MRSEFGIEIILTLAYLHDWIGISLDNVCLVMNFFTGLGLPKSQTESLLKQLARDCSKQYETITPLTKTCSRNINFASSTTMQKVAVVVKQTKMIATKK